MGKLNYHEIQTVNQFEGASRTFSALMSKYKKENESEILQFSIHLIIVTNFQMSSFLVCTVITN